MKKLLEPEIRRVTPQAVLIQVHFQSSPSLPVWFPLSQTHFETDEEGNPDYSGGVYVEDWLLQSKSETIGDEILTETEGDSK